MGEAFTICEGSATVLRVGPHREHMLPVFLNLPTRVNATPCPQSLLEDLAKVWLDAAGTASACGCQMCHESCVCVCVCTYVRNSYVYMCIDMYICVRIFKVPVCYLIQDSMREAPLCLPWSL